VGLTFLSAATLAGALGWTAVALALGGTVAALALLAATTGLCVGCLLFRGFATWRGLPLTDAVARFATTVCADCQMLPVRSEGGAQRRTGRAGRLRPCPARMTSRH
jgi:hypothetical protein